MAQKTIHVTLTTPYKGHFYESDERHPGGSVQLATDMVVEAYPTGRLTKAISQGWVSVVEKSVTREQKPIGTVVQDVGVGTSEGGQSPVTKSDLEPAGDPSATEATGDDDTDDDTTAETEDAGADSEDTEDAPAEESSAKPAPKSGRVAKQPKAGSSASDKA